MFVHRGRGARTQGRVANELARVARAGVCQPCGRARILQRPGVVRHRRCPPAFGRDAQAPMDFGRAPHTSAGGCRLRALACPAQEGHTAERGCRRLTWRSARDRGAAFRPARRFGLAAQCRARACVRRSERSQRSASAHVTPDKEQAAANFIMFGRPKSLVRQCPSSCRPASRRELVGAGTPSECIGRRLTAMNSLCWRCPVSCRRRSTPHTTP